MNNGIGFNRVEGGFSGPLAGRLTFALNGALEGRKALEDGLDSQDVPIFLQAGVDTTINQLSVLDDDPATPFDERLTADTTAVNVYNYAISRGDCDEFANAGSAEIEAPTREPSRDPQQLRPRLQRRPATRRPRGPLYSLNGKLNYTYGTGSRVSLSLAQSRFQGHSAPVHRSAYLNTLSTGMLRGFSNRNQPGHANWTQNLSKSTERALALDVALSYQQDRTINSPLTIESDLSTRDPFGGFIMEGMDFVFDFDNFPVDQGLIDNVRRTRAASRRST